MSGSGGATLYWSSDHFLEEVIPPRSYFFQPTGPCDCPADSEGRVCGSPSYGLCAGGACGCVASRTGTDCNDRVCRSPECVGNTQCMLAPQSSSFAECGGAGTCDNGECTCQQGLSDYSRCTEPACLSPQCGGHGRCVGEGCQCDEGYVGVDCSVTVCDTRSAMRAGVSRASPAAALCPSLPLLLVLPAHSYNVSPL